MDGVNGDDCIMKQENNKKRTEEELCHDITDRAEKLHVLKPKVKYVMLAVVLALFALGALNSHYKWFVMDKWWWAWLGIVVLWFLVFYVIIRQLINGMRRAATPREHLRKAKWLKRIVKIRNSLWLIIPFMPVLGNVMDACVWVCGRRHRLGFQRGFARVGVQARRLSSCDHRKEGRREILGLACFPQ